MPAINIRLTGIPLLLFGALLFSQVADAEVTPGRGRVVVSLLPAARAKESTVRVADVAQLKGGDYRLRTQMGQLEIARLAEEDHVQNIPAIQVKFRLLLAGFSEDSFQVEGKSVRLVSGTKEISTTEAATIAQVNHTTEDPAQTVRELILEAARKEVHERLPWQPEDVEIHDIHTTLNNASLPSDSDGLTFRSKLISTWPPLGSVHVGVQVIDGRGHERGTIPVQMHVVHLEPVVLAKHSIERGQTISAEDIYVDRQDVTTGGTGYHTLTDVVGKTATLPIRALQVVGPQHVSAPTVEESEVLVKQRDIVRIIVRPGQVLAVSAVGEALEDGRLGDMIRVRNVDSKTVLLGRVLSKQEVEVPL